MSGFPDGRYRTLPTAHGGPSVIARKLSFKYNTKLFGVSGWILGLRTLVARVVPRGFRLGPGNRVIFHQPREFASARPASRTKTAAFQITGFGPTLPEHPGRRLQYLLPPTSFMQ